jgi:hypothetical protein
MISLENIRNICDQLFKHSDQHGNDLQIWTTKNGG